MNAVAAIAAVAVVAAGVAAVSIREGRAISISLVVALVFAPLVTAASAPVLAIGVQGVAGALAAYLVWLAARSGVAGAGSRAGIAAQAVAAVAAFAIGQALTVVADAPGGSLPQAVGFALVALAVVPLLGRDPLRMVCGLLILVAGLALLRDAWLGAPAPLEALAVAALMVGLGAGAFAIGGTPVVSPEVEVPAVPHEVAVPAVPVAVPAVSREVAVPAVPVAVPAVSREVAVPAVPDEEASSVRTRTDRSAKPRRRRRPPDLTPGEAG